MQPDGGEAAAAPQENGKRMRRPSVRLHQPYYENPSHRKLQQQWKPTKAVTVTTPRKPRTATTAHSKIVKNSVANKRKGEEMGNFDIEDDAAIGSWRNFSAANRDRDFQRKRVRSSNSKSRVPAESRRNRDKNFGNLALSSGGESSEQEQDREQDQKGAEEEEDFGGNGISSNLVVEDSNPSSPNHSFGDDDDNGNHKLSEDNDNVGGNQVWKQRGLRDNRRSNAMEQEVMDREGDGDSSGVKMWLNDLGLGRYATLFEIHGVDDEVLPLLTLEDLKDMGINEVGVRRKLYSSIQKLERWFP